MLRATVGVLLLPISSGKGSGGGFLRGMLLQDLVFYSLYTLQTLLRNVLLYEAGRSADSPPP